MLKIYGEPESPKEKACLRHKLGLRTTSIHVTACRALQTLKLLNLELSNSQTFEIETRRTFELSISTRFKRSNFANFQSFELSNSRTFIPFKLSISETFKPSNLKPFEA